MFCSKCGYKMQPGEKFCRNCGASQNVQGAENQNQSNQNYQYQDEPYYSQPEDFQPAVGELGNGAQGVGSSYPSRTGQKRGKVIAGIVAGVVVIVAGIFAGVHFLGIHDGKSATAATAEAPGGAESGTTSVTGDKNTGASSAADADVSEAKESTTDTLPLESMESFVIIDGAEKYGLTNIDGEEILPCIYDSANIWDIMDNGQKKYAFYSIGDNSGYLLFDEHGTQISDVAYTGVGYRDGVIYASIKDHTYRLDESGQVIWEAPYGLNGSIYHGMLLVRDPESEKYGYLDADGNLVIACTFDQATNFMQDGHAVVKIVDTWYMIDKAGNTISELSFEDNIYAFLYVRDSGYAAAMDRLGQYGSVNVNTQKTSEHAYQMFTTLTDQVGFFGKQDESGVWTYGLLNDQGDEVTKEAYEEFSGACSEHEFFFKKDGKYGSVDEQGNVVKEFTYSLLGASPDQDYYFMAGDDGRICIMDKEGQQAFASSYYVQN